MSKPDSRRPLTHPGLPLTEVQLDEKGWVPLAVGWGKGHLWRQPLSCVC